jgi:TolA-binding protein
MKGGKKLSSAMNKGKKLSSEECEAPAEAWIDGSNGTANRSEQRIANLMQMLEHNRESQERNHQAVNGLQTQLMFLQEQLVHLEATEKSLKAQEEILKRQSRDLEEKISHTK